ncbi:unnamed protein product [Danaus chrysippus]|uniref:(African queen) hypothetical protein n=1 Tax=Danaus chrysippus TaxID=151541 RepID=A0A8J2QM55_9NEOP|nr:unnamed protein product [Danaus chrysippus]
MGRGRIRSPSAATDRRGPDRSALTMSYSVRSMPTFLAEYSTVLLTFSPCFSMMPVNSKSVAKCSCSLSFICIRKRDISALVLSSIWL